MAFRTPAAGLIGLSIFCASPAWSQSTTFLSGDHAIGGSLCAGRGCTSSETWTTYPTYPGSALRLKGANTGIEFDDTSSQSNNDWEIEINEYDFRPTSQSSGNWFEIKNNSVNGTLFHIDGAAPQNALYIDGAGWLGLGTSFPGANLDVVGFDHVSLDLRKTGTATPQHYRLGADSVGLYISDKENFTYPFDIVKGAPDSALRVTDTGLRINENGAAYDFQVSGSTGPLIFGDGTDGNIGFGTTTPSSFVHIQRTDGFARLFIEEGSATAEPRTLLHMLNNGRPEIVMANLNTGKAWSFGAGSNFVLKQGGIEDTSATRIKLFEIRPNGDAILTGALTTGGTTCGTGCDRVFADDYVLPSIAEHAEKMFALGHLPNVGPTVEGTPINLTDKVGGILNELEHAHIYIARQDSLIAAQAALIATQDARISRLERLFPTRDD